MHDDQATMVPYRKCRPQDSARVCGSDERCCAATKQNVLGAAICHAELETH
jgi:hypothetical protein